MKSIIKKTVTIVLSTSLLFSLTACSGCGTVSGSDNSTETTAEITINAEGASRVAAIAAASEEASKKAVEEASKAAAEASKAAEEASKAAAEEASRLAAEEASRLAAEEASRAASTQSSSSDTMRAMAEAAFAITNSNRAAAGLSALSWNETMYQQALVRANELLTSFSHTRPDGSGCDTAFSWDSAFGENIAAGQSSADSVMDSWMNSEGHRANILGSQFTNGAVACVYVEGSSYGYYWVGVFNG